MAKITLQDPQSGYSSVSTFTENNTAIEEALNDKVLYRDNPAGEDNAMQNDLDMNSNRILNLPSATSNTEPLTYGQWTGGQTTNEFTGYLNETQTATSGQTVFTLSNAYTVGIGALRVFVNGVYQAPSAYTEDSTTQITFSEGLDVGDQVAFIISSFDAAGSTDAASVTYTATGTGAVQTNIQAKLTEVLSVKDFGAAGDNSTDDSTSINAAITAANTAGGGIVFFPEGTYICDSQITLQSNVYLKGSGRGATTLYLKNSADAHVLNHTSAVTDVGVSDLTIDGNRSNQTSGVHCLRSGAAMTRGVFENLELKSARGYNIGFQAGDYTDVVFNNIWCSDSGDDGIDFKNTEDASVSVKFSNIHVNGFDKLASGSNAGIDLRGVCHLTNVYVNFDTTTSGDGVRFRSGALLSASGYGAHRSSLTNFHIVGNGNTTNGVNTGATDVSITNGHIESCYVDIVGSAARNTVSNVSTDTALDYSIKLNSGATDWTISNCVINTPADNCVRIESGADNATVTGCRFIMGAGGVEVAADNCLVEGNNFSGTGTPITFSGSGSVAGNNVGADSETLTSSSPTLSPVIPVSIIDSTSNGVGGTLGDGHRVGFIKTIVMSTFVNSSTVTVTNHETSDPEVITFNAVDETAVLMWTGTEWVTLSLNGATV